MSIAMGTKKTARFIVVIGLEFFFCLVKKLIDTRPSIFILFLLLLKKL